MCLYTYNEQSKKITNLIYSSIKKNEIFRNKAKRRNIQLILWKLQDYWNKLFGNTFYAHGLEDNIIKMAVLSKLIYGFDAIYIRISAGFSLANGKLILKFTRNCTWPRIVKGILKTKNREASGLPLRVACKTHSSPGSQQAGNHHGHRDRVTPGLENSVLMHWDNFISCCPFTGL